MNLSPSDFATIPICIGTLVQNPVSGCRDCSNVVVDDVLQRNEKFIVRRRRSTESEDHEALKHQFLDSEHLLLIFDHAESVFEFVRLIDERPEGVVELLHVFGSVLFRGSVSVPHVLKLLSDKLLVIVSP